MKNFFIFLFFILLLSCGEHNEKETISVDSTKMEFAKLFTITQLDSCRVVEVKNPWVEGELLSRYVLVHKDSILPKVLPKGVLVRVPVKRVAVYSAVDAGMIDILGCQSAIKAVCEPHFIKLDYINNRVKSGDITDLGPATKPNQELLMASSCDLIFATPYNGMDYGIVSKLGIPIADCANYMEETPLGRAEWIKFIAVFFDNLPKSNKLFDETKERYNAIKDKTSKVEKKRTILSEKRYRQTWWVPGGNSYAAKIFTDASASYFWSDDKSSGSLGLSFEEVFVKAGNADVWIMRYYKDGGDMTYDELKAEYPSYALFAPFKNKKIYACNTASSTYYTYATIQPDLELQDIALILYPELFDSVETTFYKPLK